MWDMLDKQVQFIVASPENLELEDLLPGGLLGSTAGGARADFDNAKGLNVWQECAWLIHNIRTFDADEDIFT